MRARRCVLLLGLLGLATAWSGLPGLGAGQKKSFDRLSDEDRAAFAVRFKKEIWPLLQRNGKDGCVGCHAKGGGTLRFSGNADKDFTMLLRDGFLLKDDPGNLVERVADPSPKRRMPPPKNGSAWKAPEAQVLRTFINDVHARQQ